MYRVPLSPYSTIFYNEWKLEPNRSDYNIVINQTLDGQIDVSRLGTAIRRFISEHIVLDSHIEDRNGELYWVKNNEIHELEYVENELTSKDILSYVQRPFNLESGLLYRFKLIKNYNDRHTLIVVLHHIIIDGLSGDYLFKTLSNYYNNQYYNNNISIEEQLLSITKLSKELLQYVALNKEKSKIFWQEKLLDVEPLDLSFLKLADHQNKLLSHLGQETEGSVAELSDIGEISFSFSNQVLLKLNRLNKKYIMTSYLYGRSIYAILLNKYTGQDKFCISYPITITEGIDFIYGAHINTNVIPYDFSRINNIIDVINQSKEFIKSLKSEGINHSYLPVFDIASVSNTGILNLSFAQTHLKDQNWEFTDIKASINNDTDIDLSDELSFAQEIRHEKIHYKVKYKIDKIDRLLLIEFIACYERLFIEVLDELTNLESISHITDIKDYSLLSPVQHHKIINTWNETDKDYPGDKTIHALFEEQVQKTPDNIAIVYNDTKLTYKELNEKANQLANYIIQTSNNAITPDTLIALCLDRSEHMLIGILAVLKAGGAYVPIDSSYPDERIRYILEDTATKVILTNEIHQDKLRNIIARTFYLDSGRAGNVEIIAIDDFNIWQRLLLQSSLNPVTTVTSSNLAYVIYTSGTTGNPKGVMIEHKGVVNLTTIQGENFGLIGTKDIRNCLWYSNYVFDAHVWEIYVSILNGHIIHIINNDIRQDIGLLSTYAEVNAINIATIPPALLNSENLVPLDTLVVGGDKTNKEVLEHYRVNNIKVINAYGPSEVTVCASLNQYNNNGAGNIGTPISNAKAYVLGSNMLPLPIGAIGELYIGGVGVARGYLNQAELTAERFIDNPFRTEEERSNNKNARLYKTGDLVRWLPDGNLEYIGRNDFQVKIRGYRIELGEIENSLSSFEGIKQAVVLAKERRSIDEEGTSTGNKYLVGYYVAEQELDKDDILKYLESKLPEYMIPSALVYLEKLPLTINGKLDRRALPDLELSSDKDSYVAPKNEIEKKICEIWAEILGISQDLISVKDNFFELGGNSILAIKLMNKLEQCYKSYLRVVDIFIYKNIESLSLRIMKTKNCYQPIIKLNNITDKDKPNMFMIHPGAGGCEVYSSLANLLTNNFSCYGIDSYNLYHDIKINNLYELAKYYLHYIDEIMIKTHQKEYHLLGWSLGGQISLEIASILEQKHCTKVSLYLLDTLINDDYLLLLNSTIDSKKIIAHIREESIKQGYVKEYTERLLSTICIENELAKQKISSNLKDTNIILFKAMLQDDRLDLGCNDQIYEYIKLLKYNNIEKIHNNSANIKLINLETVHHGNILEHENILINKILS